MSARTSVSMATSAGKNAACPRSASMTRSVSRPPRSSMSETTTKAPSRASRRAIARPEPPPPAPVTIATLPLSSMLHPLASLAYHDRRLKRRSAICVFPVGLRSSGRADLSLRRRAEDRSEEHTSELQSLAYLVCRLLLEKKKKKKNKDVINQSKRHMR